MAAPVSIPTSFRTAPRWRHDGAGQAWVDALATALPQQLERWRLRLDGDALHGANAVVIPVIDELYGPTMLRLTAPDRTSAASLRALAFWQGNPAMVKLLRCTQWGDALLLERLDASSSLARESPSTQAAVLAGLATELAAGPPPVGVASTVGIAHRFVDTARSRWQYVGEPFAEALLAQAEDLAARLVTCANPRPVNGDVHPDQALRRPDGRWVMIDPVLLRGDPTYDFARVLWDSHERLSSDEDIRRAALTMAAHADVDDDPLAWMFVRTVDYWLWCHRVGLTEDPFGCGRIAAALAPLAQNH